MPEFIADAQRRSNNQLGNNQQIGRFNLVHGDLLSQHDVDAIVAAVPHTLDMGGSLNRAILAAAGTQIDDFIVEHIFKPRPGDVFAVPPFNLPVGHILYAVTPVWEDAIAREDRDLIRCYRGAMQLSAQMGLKRVAFSALGSGVKKFPVKRAARLGLSAMLDRMDPSITEIRIVVNRDDVFAAWDERLRETGWRGFAGVIPR